VTKVTNVTARPLQIKRMKRLKFEGKSYSAVAKAINLDRPGDRHCSSRGVRFCLKRASASARKRIYKRKLGSVELAFIDAEVSADREVSGLDKSVSMRSSI